MVWDGIKRRAKDRGQESPDVVLARIDERTENLDDKLDEHMISFNNHTEKDEKNFAGIYKWIFIGVGIIGTLQFVIIATKH